MITRKYKLVHPQSEMGKLFDGESGTYTTGEGHPEWVLVAISPKGLFMLRRKNWLERLLRL